MSNLGIIDLPYLISMQKGTINQVQLFGVLIGEVEQPEHLRGIKLRLRDDRFAAVDLVGIQTKTGKYYVRGRALVVVNKNVLEMAKSKNSGRLAVVLFNAPVKLEMRRVPNFVQMMTWYKGEFNSWMVSKVDVAGFRREDHPEFFEVIKNAYNNGWNFTYPVQIPPSYTDACQGYEFKFIDASMKQAVQPSGWGDVNNSSTPKGWSAGQLIVSPSALTGQANGNLGVSNSSNIATLIENRVLTHAEIQSKKRFVVENRDKLAPKSKNAIKIENYIKESDLKVQKIIEKLSEFESDSNSFEDAIEYCAKQIKSSWSNKVGAYTGRALFKEALERALPDFDTRSTTGETIIVDNLNILGTRLVDEWVASSGEFEDNKFVKEVYKNRLKIYLQIIEFLLGIRDKLVDAFALAESEGIDMLTVMRSNPYNLCFIDPRMSIEDLDKLAMLYEVNLNDAEIKKVRNVAYMHNYMLDSSNRVIGDNTVVKYGVLVNNIASGFILSKRNYDNLMLEGTIIQQDKIDSLRYFVEPDVSYKNFQLPQNGWKELGRKYVLKNNQEASGLLKDYIDSGLGLLMDLNGTKYVADFIFAKKEMYIYNRLRELCENTRTRDISEEEIKKCVEEFEKLKAKELGLKEGEFKLEQRQAEAVGLVRNPVMCLTGPAGSGKTTTAEALVLAAERLLGIDSEEIMFCAPTGKAANRLKEVVKRKTRTINSLFQIGGEGLSLRDPDNVRKKDEIKLLIVDESSMPNVNLMYEMMIRIADGTRIFFLGDKEQLPPIGFGKPFATMLTFLPTVVLNVTKRASDKSGITRNAKKIIYESDGVIQDLEDTDDFRIINTKSEQEVVDYIANICRYHLGQGVPKGYKPVVNLGTDLSPDDIQIITPINGRIWGTNALNHTLHDIFNKKKPNDIAINFARNTNEKVEFRLGDRVIHIKKNLPERTRLIKVGKSSFVLANSKGIMNGEVGKIEGFYNYRDLDFSQEEDDAKQEKLKDEFKGNDNVMFLGVSFKDMDEDTGEPMEFVVLYRMEIINKSGTYIDVISSDLQYLDLAYALTVHKLQGSQAKLIIGAMLPVGRGGFISRNMIYTLITRGQLAGYLVGDVYGSESCVNKGRRIEQSSKRSSVLDNL